MKAQLNREQQLNIPLDRAWEFFSSPHNLTRITPDDMGFVVKCKNEGKPIYEGMIINYTVSPLLKIPLKWTTRITQVAYQKSFTDCQEKGPFKRWNHHHVFLPNSEGILIKDTVDYEMPLGILGKIAHQLVVKKKLQTIFDYRHRVLETMFNQEN